MGSLKKEALTLILLFIHARRWPWTPTSGVKQNPFLESYSCKAAEVFVEASAERAVLEDIRICRQARWEIRRNARFYVLLLACAAGDVKNA